MEGMPETRVKRSLRPKLIAVVIAGLIIVLFANPIVVIPAGHVGVKDFFGYVSPTTLPPGLGIVIPFTRVIKMSVQTMEFMEVADTPSKEGLIINLDVSLLYRLNPNKTVEAYKTVGRSYKEIIQPIHKGGDGVL